jgi:hypothetical protein
MMNESKALEKMKLQVSLGTLLPYRIACDNGSVLYLCCLIVYVSLSTQTVSCAAKELNL